MKGSSNAPTSRTSCPTLLVGLGVASRVSPGETSNRAFCIEGEAAALSYAFRDHGKWSAVTNVKLSDPKELFAVLKALPFDKCRPYIIAPRAHDALTLCGFWQQIERAQLTVKKPIPRKSKNPKPQYYPLILHGRPDIIGWHDGTRAYRAISIDNHVNVSLKAAADSLGMASKVPLPESGSKALPFWRPELSAEVCLKWYIYIADWWINNQCGQWADSVGAAAWNTFRAKGVPNVLRDHEAEAIQELEGASCFGGRVGTWFSGPIGTPDQWEEMAEAPTFPTDIPSITEPLTRFDVRSMYPTILRDELFPTKLVFSTDKATVGNLAAVVRDGLAVAAVRIESDRGEFPRKHDKRPQYPKGIFDCVLSTPELREALRRDEVRKVYYLAQYAPGRPFQKWADWILACRAVQKGASNVAGQELCKAMANSFSGQLGRSSKRWQIVEGVYPPSPWGEFSRINQVEKTTRKFRALGGVVFEHINTEVKRGLLAACYSHLTSYGRLRMAYTRELVGRFSTVWQDTDGIMVRRSGADRMELTGGLDSGAFGTFRTEERIDCGLFYGAKAYWIDGRWIVAGLRDSYEVQFGLWLQEQFVKNPANSAVEPKGGQLLAVKTVKNLDALKRAEQFDRQGWLVPPWSGMDEKSQPDLATIPLLCLR